MKISRVFCVKKSIEYWFMFNFYNIESNGHKSLELIVCKVDLLIELKTLILRRMQQTFIKTSNPIKRINSNCAHGKCKCPSK